MIPIQMELGGKDACIICADADLELASKNVVKVSSNGPHQLNHLRCCAELRCPGSRPCPTILLLADTLFACACCQ